MAPGWEIISKWRQKPHASRQLLVQPGRLCRLHPGRFSINSVFYGPSWFSASGCFQGCLVTKQQAGWACVSVCACVRACWNFLPPNFVKSEPKREDAALHAAARRAFVKLLAVLSSSELQPIRSLFWFLLFSRSTVGFLAPRTLLSVRGELRAAWRRPRCDFLSTPPQPQTQFTPFFPPSLSPCSLACGPSSALAPGVYTQPPRKGQLLNKEPSIMAGR